MLVRVLDGIRSESAGTKYEKRYAVGSDVTEDVWQARARAYVHLYLKVMFGIADFGTREAFVTDGGRDGGIDGYYIDPKERLIFLIQSKFRHTEENFESKPIELEELLSMQIKRVLGGDEIDEDGVKYNGKILGLQRKLGEIFDLGRYSYSVIVLANLGKVTDASLRKLTDGFEAEVLNYEKAYSLLLYPVLAGTLFKATGLGISLDLSNKSTGSKIGYGVTLEGLDCEITVVFVPTIEVARVMSTYKNSILTFNPRSYLEFEGEKVNAAIRESILNSKDNEFALLNNGITVVCDESGVNEQSGRKHKAQLFLLNPQIINGGQTAYNLSRIYEDTPLKDHQVTFGGKEVLLKAIAVETGATGKNAEQKRIQLIERISTATNSQTTVTLADRTSSDPLNLELQQILFQKYGILYERKRGEFGEGLRNGYITTADIFTRVHFIRIHLTSNGRLAKALRKRLTIQALSPNVARDTEQLDNTIIGLAAFAGLRRGRSVQGVKGYVSILPKVYAAVEMAKHLDGSLKERGAMGANIVENRWTDFLDFAGGEQMKFVRLATNPHTRSQYFELREGRTTLGADFEPGVKAYFQRALASS
jgi:hypothetical protein